MEGEKEGRGPLSFYPPFAKEQLLGQKSTSMSSLFLTASFGDSSFPCVFLPSLALCTSAVGAVGGERTSLVQGLLEGFSQVTHGVGLHRAFPFGLISPRRFCKSEELK